MPGIQSSALHSLSPKYKQKDIDVVLVFGFWRCTVPSKKMNKIKTLLHESSPKIIFILCLAPYLNPAFSHLHQPSLSDIFIRQIEHPPSLEDKTKIQKYRRIKTENELLAYRDDLYISLFKTLSMFNISIQHCNRIFCYNCQHRLYNI